MKPKIPFNDPNIWGYLHRSKRGGHPNICALHEHFDEGGYYYLILDLVEGGEMFDHLVNHGAYSEADAARLVREVASALDYLHGIGVVHNDIKPEVSLVMHIHISHCIYYWEVMDISCLSNVLEIFIELNVEQH